MKVFGSSLHTNDNPRVHYERSDGSAKDQNVICADPFHQTKSGKDPHANAYNGNTDECRRDSY